MQTNQTITVQWLKQHNARVEMINRFEKFFQSEEVCLSQLYTPELRKRIDDFSAYICFVHWVVERLTFTPVPLHIKNFAELKTPYIVYPGDVYIHSDVILHSNEQYFIAITGNLIIDGKLQVINFNTIKANRIIVDICELYTNPYIAVEKLQTKLISLCKAKIDGSIETTFLTTSEHATVTKDVIANTATLEGDFNVSGKLYIDNVIYTEQNKKIINEDYGNYFLKQEK